MLSVPMPSMIAARLTEKCAAREQMITGRESSLKAASPRLRYSTPNRFEHALAIPHILAMEPPLMKTPCDSCGNSTRSASQRITAFSMVVPTGEDQYPPTFSLSRVSIACASGSLGRPDGAIQPKKPGWVLRRG